MQCFVRRPLIAAVLYIAAFAFTSCTGGGSGAVPNPNIGVSQGQQPGRAATSSLLYVVNRAEFQSPPSSVTAYPAGASGNIAPTVTLAGPNTGLGNSLSDAFDSKGNLYVTSGSGGCGPPCVRIFAPGASGNVAPIGAICGVAASLLGTGLMALDNAGNIYAVTGSFGLTTINVYRAGTLTSVAPAFTLNPQGDVEGLAFDASNRLYVPHNQGAFFGGTIDVFAPGASGNTPPVATIGGDMTGLNFPSAIAIDSVGKIYIANTGFGVFSVTVYAAGANGNVPPIATIKGSATRLLAPQGLAVDSSGIIYVANSNDEILEFPPGANGNVAPSGVIGGSNTGLRQPVGMTVH